MAPLLGCVTSSAIPLMKMMPLLRTSPQLFKVGQLLVQSTSMVWMLDTSKHSPPFPLSPLPDSAAFLLNVSVLTVEKGR